MFSMVVGTRPEIVKMAPLILELDAKGIEYELIHTRQHYNFNMSELFFEELELPRPDHFLDVGSGSQASQTSKALIKLEDLFIKGRPENVIVEGDTNSVLASALAAVKLNIDVGHVESGLRSFDKRMPEEHNRILTDHISTHLFAPTNHTEEILRMEGVQGKIFVTGNTVIDACIRYMPVALKRSNVMEKVGFDEFALVTAHRAENVDDEKVLKNFLKIFLDCPIPVVYPVHPRTLGKFKEFGLYEELKGSENVQLIEPTGYFDFLVLMKKCAFVITDSGGIQEEITAPNIGKRAFVVRLSTDRQEAVEAGYAEVVGVDHAHVLGRIRDFIEEPTEPKGESPYGTGNAAQRIADILVDEYGL
jgi:UDP-N-acetylglucosamine 2-epimerase (non-hydrolysing)